MHGGRGDEAVPAVSPRVSEADRDRVVARLRDAAGDGLFDLDELERRLAGVYAADTLDELTPITADLPAPEVDGDGTEPVCATNDAAFRFHLRTWAMVNAMLVGIWLLAGGGHFWPFYPAAGWGIGLAVHAEMARVAQRRRRRRSRQPRERHRAVGAALPAPRPQPLDEAPTHRYVVALFVDVVNSTQLNEALGDERWVAVRRSYRELVQACITRHGGWEANCSGDGVLARFDQPESAVRAAVELLRRLDRRRAETGFAPSVRVGVHSGDAVDEDGDIIGTVVNLAARVTDAADVDEILVTEHVADHLDGTLATSGRGLHTLKGVGRPRHLLAVDWR